MNGSDLTIARICKSMAQAIERGYIDGGEKPDQPYPYWLKTCEGFSIYIASPDEVILFNHLFSDRGEGPGSGYPE